MLSSFRFLLYFPFPFFYCFSFFLSFFIIGMSHVPAFTILFFFLPLLGLLFQVIASSCSFFHSDCSIYAASQDSTMCSMWVGFLFFTWLVLWVTVGTEIWVEVGESLDQWFMSSFLLSILQTFRVPSWYLWLCTFRSLLGFYQLTRRRAKWSALLWVVKQLAAKLPF